MNFSDNFFNFILDPVRAIASSLCFIIGGHLLKVFVADDAILSIFYPLVEKFSNITQTIGFLILFLFVIFRYKS